MTDLLFKNPNTLEWDSMFEDYRDTLYPVGSVILSANDDFSPSETIGGSWNKIQDNAYMRFANVASTGGTGGNWQHTHQDAFGWEPAPTGNPGMQFWGWRDAQGFAAYGTNIIENTQHFVFSIRDGDFQMTSLQGGPTRVNKVETVVVEPPYLALAAWQRVA